MLSYDKMQSLAAATDSRVSKEGIEAYLDWLEANGSSPREVYLQDDQSFAVQNPEAGTLSPA